MSNAPDLDGQDASAAVPADPCGEPEPYAGRTIRDVPLPQHVNYTPFPSQVFQTVDQHGSIFHVLVLRITFDMNALDPGDSVMFYASKQTPLATADTWVGEPGASAPLSESDFAPFKPRCDILIVNGQSTAPAASGGGRWGCAAAVKGTRTDWLKRIAVTGPRTFGAFGLSGPSGRGPVDVHYGNAFGGERKWPEADVLAGDGKTVKERAGQSVLETDERNPVGVGFGHSFLTKAPTLRRAPQLEPLAMEFAGGGGQRTFPPVGLTAIGRSWLPRRGLAGTYDQKWQETQWPLPPMDFDYAYWQSAPVDQQIDYPEPGLEITLANLLPDQETWRARLPHHVPFARVLASPLPSGESPAEDVPLNLDTIVIDADGRQVAAVYRCVLDADEDVARVEARMLQVFSHRSCVPDEEIERQGGIRLNADGKPG